MWPWEHLAFGYLLLSFVQHVLVRDRVSGNDALLLAIGTQFPDIIDKPLAWSLHLLPAGVLAHTIVIALPIVIAAIALASLLGRFSVGIAFAIGYLSHLVGDIVYPLFLGQELKFGIVLWPFVPHTPPDRVDFIENVVFYFQRYTTHIMSPEGLIYLSLEVSLLSLALLVWIIDGRPGVDELKRMFAPIFQFVRL